MFLVNHFKIAVVVLVLICGNSVWAQRAGKISGAGDLIFQYEAGGPITSSPAIGSDGTIYFGSDDCNLYAINPDGTLRWKLETGGPVKTSPAVSENGTVYFGSEDQYFYAVNPDGTLKWNYNSGYPIRCYSPAIGKDNIIYISFVNHNNLYAFNPDGTIKWQFLIDGNISSTPSIDSDGTIYIGSKHYLIYAINPDCTMKWKYNLDGHLSTPIVIGDKGNIYFGTIHTVLYAVQSDGTEKWNYDLDMTIPRSLVIGKDGAILVGVDKFIGIKSDGSQYWYYGIDGVRSSPIVGNDGTVYIGSTDHNLYAVSPNNTVKWKYRTGGSIETSPAISSDGIIYIGSNDNCLYAIDSGTNAGLGDSPWPMFGQNNFHTNRSDEIGTYITVTFPNGNDILIRGFSYDITWTSRNIENVDIEYSIDDGANWETIVSSIDAASGSYSWMVPNIKSNSCLIKITSTLDPSLTDQSDRTFIISDPILELVTPIGNEKWLLETTQNINWTGIKVDSVKIEYSIDDGSNWEMIVSSIEAVPGSYSWMVPNVRSSYFLIRITDIVSGVTDQCDSAFTIGTILEISSPNGGENWTTGTTQKIIWRNYDEEKVTIEYSTNGGSSWTIIDSNVSASIGSYSWMIPDTQSTQCIVKITDASNSSVYDMSDCTFSIELVPEFIEIITPNGGEKWAAGSNHNIRWLSYGLDNVTIEYSTDGGMDWTTIGLSVSAIDCSCSWMVPAIYSNQYLVRITDASNSSVYDISNDMFSGGLENEAGNLIFRYDTGSKIFSSPAIGSNGTIYIGSKNRNLYALYPDGTLKWNYQTNGEIESSPAIGNDGTIYIGSNDNHLYAVNPDGTEKWRFETDDDVISSPAINDETIFVGSNDRNLFAIDTQGNLRWKYETDDEKRENILVNERMQSWKGFDHNGAIRSSPSIGIDGAIYFGAMDEHLYSLSTSGTLNWRSKVDFKQESDSMMGWDITTKLTNGFIFSSPAIDNDGTIYVGTDNNDLYAFESNSNVKWKIHFSDNSAGNEFSSPAIGNDGTIYIGSVDCNLYAVNPDGTIKWNFPTGDRIDSSPLISKDNTVFFGSDDGFMYSLDQDGNLLWKFQTDGSINSSPNLNDEGILFFGSEDGHLYAINTGNAGLAETPWPMFGQNGYHRRRSAVQSYMISGSIIIENKGFPNVSVTLSGDKISDKDVLTAPSGEYSFKGLLNGAYTITPYKKGYVFNPSSLEVILNNADVSVGTFEGEPVIDKYGELITHTRKSKESVDWSPDGNWIAYGQGGDIWVISSEGGEPKNLTEDFEYSCYAPTFTPDSREVAFTYHYINKSKRDDPYVTIKARNIETLEEHGIWDMYSYYPAYTAWSNDGKFHAISGILGVSSVRFSVSDLINIISYDLSYEVESRFYSRSPTDICFAPDNSHIITHGVKIYFSTGKVENIAVGGSPDYYPDGRWLMSTYGNNLYVYNTETGLNYPVFQDQAYYASNGKFSPDGSKICYLHPINGFPEVFIADFPYYEPPIVTSSEETPAEFSVSIPYPNPFNPSTTIQYEIPEDCFVRITIYDILGRKVTVLQEGVLGAGTYSAVWDGRDNNGNLLGSGVYLYRFDAGRKFFAQGKLLFVH